MLNPVMEKSQYLIAEDFFAEYGIVCNLHNYNVFDLLQMTVFTIPCEIVYRFFVLYDKDRIKT